MRKVAIVIVVLLSVCFKGNSQDISYGPMLGINLTAFSDGFAPLVSDYSFGYQAGANINLRFTKLIGANAQVFYSSIGANNVDADLLYASGSSFVQDISSLAVTLHTIDVTLLANVYLPFQVGPLEPKILVGASAAFNMKAVASNQRDYSFQSSTSVDDITDRLAYNDIAVVGGIGFEMELADNLLLIDVRYRLGLTNINNVGLKDSFNNTGFALVVGYNF